MADSITIPVLILQGGAPRLLRNPGAFLAALLPNATTRVLEGHGAPADVDAPILEAFARD